MSSLQHVQKITAAYRAVFKALLKSKKCLEMELFGNNS